MFDNPLTRPVAITEMLLLLLLASFTGWLIARLIFTGQVKRLVNKVIENEKALEQCRYSKTAMEATSAHTLISTPRNFLRTEPSEVTNETEKVVLSRLAARSTELNFDRIGFATSAEADDLQAIVGIGPYIEKKLHSLGIYTFRQVANFVTEDIEKVTELIEFFPGRIERDNWVGQARTLFESKYGRKINS